MKYLETTEPLWIEIIHEGNVGNFLYKNLKPIYVINSKSLYGFDFHTEMSNFLFAYLEYYLSKMKKLFYSLSNGFKRMSKKLFEK